MRRRKMKAGPAMEDRGKIMLRIFDYDVVDHVEGEGWSGETVHPREYL